MIIDYKSIPVYNYSYVANPIYASVTGGGPAIFTDVARKESVWNCTDWITYFEKLKIKYGESKAKEIWSFWWNLGVSKGAGGAGDIRAGSGLVYDSVPLDCRTTSTDFRAFISKYKLTDVVYTGLGIIAKPIGVAADVVTNIGDVAVNTSKTLNIVVPIVIVVSIGLSMYWAYNKFVKV